jgi:hypothetical protein
MTMRHSIAILSFICIGGLSSVAAQDQLRGSTLTAQYTISIPLGNTRKFVDKASLRGWTFDYKYHFNDVGSVGATIGWYVFYDKHDYDSYTIRDESMTLSGLQYRYVNSVPMMATFNYFLPTGKVSPFAGLGIGTTYNEEQLVMGMYAIQVNTWHFTLAPELGVRMNATASVSGFLSARYNNNFETTELKTQSYLGLNFGVMWKL